jgi:hypothetical protein
MRSGSARSRARSMGYWAAPGVAEHVAGDRLQQEPFHQPDGMACRDGAGDDGRERATVAACGSSPASRSAAMTVRMTAGWRSWSSISARAASLAATAVWWALRTSPPRGSPRPRPPPLYAQNDNSEPSARSPSALGPPTRTASMSAPDSASRLRRVTMQSACLGRAIWLDGDAAATRSGGYTFGGTDNSVALVTGASFAGSIRSSAERPDRGSTRLDHSRVDDRAERRISRAACRRKPVTLCDHLGARTQAWP